MRLLLCLTHLSGPAVANTYFLFWCSIVKPYGVQAEEAGIKASIGCFLIHGIQFEASQNGNPWRSNVDSERSRCGLTA